MTKIYYITIADKIKVYRSKYNVTQRSFAKLLGVSAQAIHKWEKQLQQREYYFTLEKLTN